MQHRFTRRLSKFFGLLLFLSAFPLSASAQMEEGYLQPDRPDQSEGVAIVAPRELLFEWGGGYSTQGASLGGMLRYGVVKDLELRLEALGRREPASHLQLTSVTLSSKLGLFSGDGWIPAMTLVGYLNYDPEDERHVFGDLCLALEQELTDGLTLVANVASAEGMRRLFLTGELSYNINERLGCFGEYYVSLASGTRAIPGVDLGLAYSLSKDVQIDLSVGRTYGPSGKVDYMALGGSLRL